MWATRFDLFVAFSGARSISRPNALDLELLRPNQTRKLKPPLGEVAMHHIHREIGIGKK